MRLPLSLKLATIRRLMLSPTLQAIHAELGIPEGYGQDGRPRLFAEAEALVEAGPNLMGRMQRLAPAALDAWQRMQGAARDDGVVLLIVSGFRSYMYQANLISKKIESGQILSEILKVNAAPGYSEHHTGGALDIASPGSRPLTEEFENSAAFGWLTANAATYGFGMSYPRGNADGFIYEPWHWALTDVVTN